MQIILVQAELEKFIRAGLDTKLILQPGASYTIDLVATRGETGFKATVDIIEAPERPIVVGTLVSPEVAVRPPFGGFQGALVSAVSTTTIPAQTAPSLNTVLSSGLVPSSPAEVRAMMANEPEVVSSEPVAAEADTAQVVEEAPVRAATSLFKGLRKPVNA